MRNKKALILFLVSIFFISCQKNLVLQQTLPIEKQTQKTETIKPSTIEKKEQKLPIMALPPNITVDYYKNYEEEMANGIILPIQIKNNKFEFVKDHCVNNLDLTNLSTQVNQDFSLNAMVETSYPAEFPGEWIIASQQYYYFLSTKNTNNNDDFSLVCLNKNSNKIQWETRLCPYNPYCRMVKILDCNNTILVTMASNFHIYSINKQNGAIQWAKAIQPDILKELVKEPNNGCKDILLFPKYQFEQGVVYNFYSKCYNPDNKQADLIVDKTFFLSLDGTTSNVLTHDPIAFYQNTYFYTADNKYICASILDNHLIWETELSGFPIFGKDPFLFCQYRRTLHIVDKKTGEMVDTKTIPSIMDIKDVVNLDDTYYLIGERQYKPIGNDHGGIQNDVVDEHFLLIWSNGQTIKEIKIQQPQQPVIIDFRNIIGIYPLKEGLIIFFQSGFIVMDNLTCTFTKYPFPNEEETMISFNEYPIIFANKDKFVIAFIPNDRGFVMGGKIMVLKVHQKE